jgi:hypothetical protein
MFADWSVVMGADDPVVAVPWADESGRTGYINLRESPENINQIPEAAAHPALATVLRLWNTKDIPWRTLKCDVFILEQDKLHELTFDLDIEKSQAAFGFTSYIDVAFNAPQNFSSFKFHEDLLRTLTASAEAVEIPNATAEFVLRRCILPDSSAEGFCISIYINGVASTQASAYEQWSTALTAQAQPLLIAAIDLATRALPPIS